jgi:hypothetical protein
VIQVLNGQGTPRDLPAAVELYEKAAYWGHWNVLLAAELDEQLAQPDRVFSNVDYCDVAALTSEMNQCAHLAFRLTEQQAGVERARVRARLPAASGRELDSLQAEFLKNREAIAEMEADDTFGGTGSGGFVASRRDRLEQLHAERIQRWLIARSFEPATSEELDDARRVQAHVLQERRAMGRRRPHLLEQERLSAAKYRELWVRLAQRQAPRPLSPEGVERSVLAALLLEQAEQLSGESFSPPRY